MCNADVETVRFDLTSSPPLRAFVQRFKGPLCVKIGDNGTERRRKPFVEFQMWESRVASTVNCKDTKANHGSHCLSIHTQAAEERWSWGRLFEGAKLFQADFSLVCDVMNVFLSWNGPFLFLDCLLASTSHRFIVGLLSPSEFKVIVRVLMKSLLMLPLFIFMSGSLLFEMVGINITWGERKKSIDISEKSKDSLNNSSIVLNNLILGTPAWYQSQIKTIHKLIFRLLQVCWLK